MYCEARSTVVCFGLNWNDGPYLVTSQKRPDLLQVDAEILVIRMGGISAQRIPALLNRLSQDLTTGDARAGRMLYEEIKQRL